MANEIPKHEGTGIHCCCMDERPSCEQHRRATYDSYPGGAFALMSAAGAFLLLSPDTDTGAKMWQDVEIALSINPRIELVACAHTFCAGATAFGYLPQGLSEEDQVTSSFKLLDQVGQLLEQRLRQRYPDFSYKLQVIDIRNGQAIDRSRFLTHPA